MQINIHGVTSIKLSPLEVAECDVAAGVAIWRKLVIESDDGQRVDFVLFGEPNALKVKDGQ